MRPARSVLTVGAIVSLEGLLLLSAGIFVGVRTLTGQPHDRAEAVWVLVLAVIAGVGLLFVGVGLLRGRRWGQAPAVLTQIIALPVAVGMIQSGLYAIGVPLIVVAVAGLVLLFSRSFTRAMFD